jgi:2-polyprenyl-6-methoxyphenol hydroxylase-like FAD-dependent oxidoreductase
MAAVRSVLVVGGGIGGLALGTALAQRGIEADVVEIKDAHSPLGVGIIQPGNALRALDAIGVARACVEAGHPMHRRRYLDSHGRELVARDMLQVAKPPLPPQNALPRPALHHILHEAALKAGASVRMGTRWIGLEETGEGVTVTFADGSSRRYDLVVAADGIRSELRAKLFGVVEPRYSGYGCWRVTLPRPPDMVSNETWQGVNGTKGGLIPLTRETMYLFLVTTEPEHAHKPREQLAPLLKAGLEGYGGLIGEIRDSLDATSDINYAALEETALPLPWHRGRIQVIGDAAHASLPHMAQGAAMALEDAVVLAELCAEDLTPEERGQRFAARRYERCMFVQKTSRAMADSQQDYTPETVLEQQEILSREFPQRWIQNDSKMAEPI